MPATPNPLMNSKLSKTFFFFSFKNTMKILDPANDILYGLHQSRVDRSYTTNIIDVNKASEQDKLLNTAAIRTDLKLSVNSLTNFSNDV